MEYWKSISKNCRLVGKFPEFSSRISVSRFKMHSRDLRGRSPKNQWLDMTLQAIGNLRSQSSQNRLLEITLRSILLHSQLLMFDHLCSTLNQDSSNDFIIRNNGNVVIDTIVVRIVRIVRFESRFESKLHFADSYQKMNRFWVGIMTWIEWIVGFSILFHYLRFNRILEKSQNLIKKMDSHRERQSICL